MHTSTKMEQCPCEFINVVPLNPLVSKVEIKVCYVSDEPNRNGSVITKEVAKEIANSLPSSPIVGYYNEGKEDFEGHNRVIDISGGEFKIKDTTRPYGFVDMNAKVWFQKYMDDDGVEREYLCTEGYLWTGQYPEAQRVIERGSAQSMELDEFTLDGSWSKLANQDGEFFIINEAIISKLCLLGEDVEPCFEGASVTQFSFGDSFKEQLFSLMNEMKKIIQEGGVPEMNTENEVLTFEEEVQEQEETVVVVEEEIEEPATEIVFEEEEKEDEEVCEKCGKPLDECECEDEEEETYSLDQIPEYVDLAKAYNELSVERDQLMTSIEALHNEIAELKAYKLKTERIEKQKMIDSFTMLTNEDKIDVISNIDNYSLDDIEAKLSIICVRNKVSFSLDEDKTQRTDPITYNLNGSSVEDSDTPAWVKAVLATQKNMN